VNGSLKKERPVYCCERRDYAGFPGWTDSVWEGLPQIRFVETKTGKAPRLVTIAEAFWSPGSGCLYFRFTGEDDEAVSTMTNHDDPIFNEDVVEVFISETGSLHRYKEFEVSPANVRFDAIIHNDLKGGIRVYTDWHAVGWRTETSYDRQKSKFTSVWEIPFCNFEGGLPSVGDEWRMNCYRIDRSSRFGDEYSAWSPTGEIQFHIPEAFGMIRFV